MKKWLMNNQHDGIEIVGLGEYLEIDRPRRLVFTFAIPQFGPGVSRIVVEIAPEGTGCVLTLSHEQLPPEYHAGTVTGWRQMFDTLEGLLRKE